MILYNHETTMKIKITRLVKQQLCERNTDIKISGLESVIGLFENLETTFVLTINQYELIPEIAV
jgi:hypothetical protein